MKKLFAIIVLCTLAYGCSTDTTDHLQLLIEQDNEISAQKVSRTRVLVPEQDTVIMNAAIDGNAEAQYLIGAAFKYGLNNYPSDYILAAYWFDKASVQHHTDAREELGDMYWRGLGITKNEYLGEQLLGNVVEWYGNACDKGFKSACTEYFFLRRRGY